MQSNQVLTYDEVKSFFKNAPLYFAEGESFEEAIEVFKKAQVKTPDYEISFFRGKPPYFGPDKIFELHTGGGYYDVKCGTPVSLDSLLNNGLCVKSGNIEIYSIRRLSDGEQFTIGDKVYWYVDNDITTITEFRLTAGGHLNIYGEGFGILLEALKKVKPQPKVKLFTTEDGVDVFEGDFYHAVCERTFFSQRVNYKCGSGYLNFHSKEAADQYILANKPIQVSYNELKEFLSKNLHTNNYAFVELPKFFKTKINP